MGADEPRDASDLCAAPSLRPSSVALVPTVPPVRPPAFALAGCGCPQPQAWVFGQPGPSPALSWAEMTGSPVSWRNPGSRMPCSLTPVGLAGRTVRLEGVFSPREAEGSPCEASGSPSAGGGLKGRLRPRCAKRAWMIRLAHWQNWPGTQPPQYGSPQHGSPQQGSPAQGSGTQAGSMQAKWPCMSHSSPYR